MGVVIIWLLGEDQQLAMAIVANAFNSDHPKQTMVLQRAAVVRIWVWVLWGGLIDGEAFKDLTGWARAADSNN